MGKEARQHRFLGNAAVADYADRIDRGRRLGQTRARGNQHTPSGLQTGLAGRQPTGRGISKVSLIFTGLEPCGEHKYWCVPKFGFTGRICTPSLLEKIGSCVEERLIILDRSHHSQTVGRPRRPSDRIFPLVSVPHTGPLDRGLPSSLPEPDGFSPVRFLFFLNCIPFRRSPHSHGILIRRGFRFVSESHSSLYGFSARFLDGRDIALRAFEGQVLLVVNTASRCGFTPRVSGPATPLSNLSRSRVSGFRVSLQSIRASGARIRAGDPDLLPDKIRRYVSDVRQN